MGARGENLMEAKWYIAWCHYRLGELDRALETFDWMLANGARRQKIGDQVEYWKARALIESGRKGEGASLLRTLAHKSNYYGEISKRRLNGDSRTYKDFALVRSGVIGKKTSGRHLPAVESLKQSNINLAKAVALIEIGLNKFAAMEVRAAEKKGASVDAFTMMDIARASNAHDVGYRIALQKFGSVLSGSPGGGESLYIWEQAYPEAYRSVTEKFVNGSHIDEKLVWAIMKAESNFRPEVGSPAGAIGLMQMMPTTARKVLGNNPHSDFDSWMLTDPETNIELSVRYLKDFLWSQFPADHVSIIASYNAGEEAVARWLKNKPIREDIEIFVEEIPYSETCLYVKRVLFNYWTMQRLYG